MKVSLKATPSKVQIEEPILVDEQNMTELPLPSHHQSHTIQQLHKTTPISAPDILKL